VRPYTGDYREVCLPACGFSRMRQMRDITVVIVTHNRAGMLQQTLECLAALSYAARWQALVVDNGCTDDTPNVVRAARRHFPVRLQYISEPQLGKYRALNTAIAAVDTTFIAATDDDALPDYELRVAFWAGELRECWRGDKRREGLVAPTDAVPRPNHGSRSQAS